MIVVTGLPHSGDDTTAEYVVRSFVVNAAIRNYRDESLVTKVVLEYVHTVVE